MTLMKYIRVYEDQSIVTSHSPVTHQEMENYSVHLQENVTEISRHPM